MVSLVNFRTFSDLADEHQLTNTTSTNTRTSEAASRPETNQNQNAPNQQYFHIPPTLDKKQHKTKSSHSNSKSSSNNYNINNNNNNNNNDFSKQQQQPVVEFLKPSDQQAAKEHFEIRWTNLNYQVEPKWYQRLTSSSPFASSASTSSAGGGGSNDNSSDSALSSDGSDLGSSSKKTKKSNDASNAPQRPRRANILNGLNGSVKSGEVTAILGPSGAGKTSLLGCLTGKNKSGVTGAVEVISTNGGPGRLEPLSVCQIPQKDFLLNQLTVRENLWFASRLKHPEEPFDHDSNIDRVVELLKLDTCIDTKISKISGGQYKRVSIAQELLSNPDILILDEPTSGLDSLTCYRTVMVLRDLARLSPNPMAIIVTIHQPQREVFDLFNHVYILAIGGRCIYEGPPSQSINTINESGTGLNFDTGMYNPASYLVEIASAEFGEKPIEVLVQRQRDQFKNRTLAQDQRNLMLDLAGANALGHDGDVSYHDMGGTPKRPRSSPMIARFKSTLSNLKAVTTGSSSPTLQISSPRARRMAQLNSVTTAAVGPPPVGIQHSAYTNEAFASSLSLNKSPAGSNNMVDTTIVNVSPPSKKASVGDDNKRLSANNTNSPSTQQQMLNEQQHQMNNSMYMSTTGVANSNANVITRTGSDATMQPEDEQEHHEEDLDDGEFYLDSRLQTHKHNHQGHFLRHCQLLTKRSWLCLCKDPMLTTLRFSAHIIVPLLITLVYGSRVGKPNACPLYESDMDLIDYARRGAKRLLNLQDELRCTFENVGLYFLSVYAFTFSTMCLTSLSFPLNMHVLLKEVRNGWYSIPTYFIGKTLADFPLEFILPTLTLMITYPLTGQPSSYMEWRFLLATSVFVVTSLIAQTQGLIFGALFMNAMQAAVFVAPVSTTPLILLSGFLIRISQMPAYLQKLSTLSYFRYAIESLTIIRYGFGQCECDPRVVTGKPVSASGVPDQLRTMTNYWLSTFDTGANDGGLSADGGDSSYSLGGESGLNDTLTEIVTTSTRAATTALAENATGSEQPVDFFQDLTVLLARANSFGADIKTCKDLKPYPMIDFSLEDNQLYTWLAALVATLIVSKIANYIVVKYSVKWRL
uniref:ATP-binding cassette sub-family G member 1 n=1 Tax=Aceria tosichella TaxID=561515 RepID=A0A6G1S5P4_9ACAR